MTWWAGDFVAGQSYGLGYTNDSGGGAALNTPPAELMFVTPIWVPGDVTVGTTKLGVHNADTTASNLQIRLGIYQVSDPESFLLDTLIVDAGTITKDTTAATTRRFTSTFTEVFLGPNKLYCLVSRIEVANSAGTGFTSGMHPTIKPGAVGDNAVVTDAWLGLGQQVNVAFANCLVLDTNETGALDADYSALGVPTYPSDTSFRAPAIYVYVNSVS